MVCPTTDWDRQHALLPSHPQWWTAALPVPDSFPGHRPDPANVLGGQPVQLHADPDQHTALSVLKCNGYSLLTKSPSAYWRSTELKSQVHWISEAIKPDNSALSQPQPLIHTCSGKTFGGGPQLGNEQPLVSVSIRKDLEVTMLNFCSVTTLS